jgi:hypothetical protein
MRTTEWLATLQNILPLRKATNQFVIDTINQNINLRFPDSNNWSYTNRNNGFSSIFEGHSFSLAKAGLNFCALQIMHLELLKI